MSLRSVSFTAPRIEGRCYSFLDGQTQPGGGGTRVGRFYVTIHINIVESWLPTIPAAKVCDVTLVDREREPAAEVLKSEQAKAMIMEHLEGDGYVLIRHWFLGDRDKFKVGDTTQLEEKMMFYVLDPPEEDKA